MLKNFLFILLLTAGLWLQAQPLQRYTLSSQNSETCVCEVSLELFDKGLHRDKLNSLISRSLLSHHYLFDTALVSLKNFYRNHTFKGDTLLGFDIRSSLVFSKHGLYSFVACPYNACDHRPHSEMQTMVSVLDSAAGKLLGLRDIVEPARMDTLQQFALLALNRYHIKNTPTCNYISQNPVTIQSANSYLVQSNVITYEKGLQSQFYIENGYLHLYNNATHSAYTYNSVELALPVRLLAYFLKPEFVKRVLE